MTCWVVTTFANKTWEVYALKGLDSLALYLPQHFKICVGLDDPVLLTKVKNCIEKVVPAPIFTPAGMSSSEDPTQLTKKLTLGVTRDYHICAERSPDHREFIALHGARDHPQDYRLQAARFCHKIFFLKYFFDRALEQSSETRPEYVVWWDADAHMTRPVCQEEWQRVMPGPNEACSYLGRKDWDHSECGFMAFRLAHEGAGRILDFMITYYLQGLVFSLPQWHDSYLFDVARQGIPCKNISEGVAGNNVWAGTTLGSFSEHWKGPQAKARKKALTDAELFGDNKTRDT